MAKRVNVKTGEELNGLGTMFKEVLDKNLSDGRKYDSVRKLNASVVIREATSGVAITLTFRSGDIQMQNDAIDRPTASMEADFETLAYIGSGQLSPIRAMLTRKLKTRGNFITLLKVSRITVLK
jgi:putative sterol carrier protein